MKEKPILYVIIALLLGLGALIVWRCCCRNSHDSHVSPHAHSFKIWKGYIQKESMKESEFTNLKIVKFLNDSYYFSDIGDKAIYDTVVYFLNIAHKVPTAGSSYKAKEGITGPDTINLLSIVDDGFLDVKGEFMRCETTGRYGCYPKYILNPIDTLLVQKDGVDKILLKLLVFIHKMERYEWGYLEINPADYKGIIRSFEPDPTATCLSLVLDGPAVNITYDNGNSYLIFLDYDLR